MTSRPLRGKLQTACGRHHAIGSPSPGSHIHDCDGSSRAVWSSCRSRYTDVLAPSSSNPQPTLGREIARCWSWCKFLRAFVTRPELRIAAGLPPRTVANLLRRGFWPDRQSLYRLDLHDPAHFLSDQQLLLTRFIDGPYAPWLDDKYIFYSRMRGLASLPRLLALVSKGHVEWCEGPPARDLVALVEREGKVVVKPPRRCSGRDVALLECRAEGLFYNRRPISAPALQAKLLGAVDLLVTAFVSQGAYASRLFPDTVNTVRLVTMLDPDSGAAFVGSAAQRVGCARTFPVDNVTAGGFAVEIDERTGRLGRAFRIESFKPCYCERHPDSGTVFAEETIPGWPHLVAQVLELAARFPMLPYAAWDLAILDEGFTVLEGNSWAGVFVSQPFRPLLADPRVRRFFQHHGIA
jgi:hypothetical protein